MLITSETGVSRLTCVPDSGDAEMTKPLGISLLNTSVLVPRINTVEGLTEAHIQKWGWNVNEKGWVNFPDVQTRIYKNSDKIYWVNKVHERIVGFESYTNFPADEIYCIRHPKTIDRQERQNNYYDTL